MTTNRSQPSDLVGQIVYTASDQRYYGKGTVLRQADDLARPSQDMPLRTYVVEMTDGRKGRFAEDQIFSTRQEAQDKATTHIVFHR